MQVLGELDPAVDVSTESQKPFLTLLDEIRSAVANGDVERARSCANRMLEDDALALLEDLTTEELSRLFVILGDESLALLLSRLDDRDAAHILTRMFAAQAADILEQIEPDDATDIFAEVEQANPEIAGTILIEMDPVEAAEIRDLLAYDPDSAGGIMTPAFIAVFPELRADQTVAALRKVAEQVRSIHYVYVVDRSEKLLGVLSLSRLVLSRPETPVNELMVPNVISVEVTTDRVEAARILTGHDFLSLPVVDAGGRLLGIITSDDVHEILEEEATEDIERLGGSQPLEVPYLRAKPSLLFRKRIVWLLVLFVAQFFTVSIQEHYESILAQVTLLAVFVPILIGTGGNVGSQTVSTIIRAMALGEVHPRHILRIIGKEALTGLGLGIVMGVMMFGRAMFTGSGDVNIALTVGLTILALCTWAATVGAVLPIVLSKLRFDPAVVSAPFISSFVDSTGLIIYFTLAGILLKVN